MTTLSPALRQAIRFEANYSAYFRALMMINKNRFRVLGDDYCRSFVALASQMGDELRFQRQDSVAYLMLLMHWLGSHFRHDPRYKAVSTPIEGIGNEYDRIEAARDAFLDIVDTHIGDGAAIFLKRVQQLPDFEHLVTDTSKSHHKLHDALLDTWEIQGEARSAYPRDALEAEVVLSARALGIDTPMGRRICLVLTFVLGARFHADPLYPWVKDKVAAAQEEGASPEEALLEYAKKRLAAMVRAAKEPDDV